jgi:hypothetical protein
MNAKVVHSTGFSFISESPLRIFMGFIYYYIPLNGVF